MLFNWLLLSKQNQRFVALGPPKTISIKYTQGLQWGQSVNREKDIFTCSCPTGQRLTLQNINLPILLVYAGQSEGVGQCTKEKGFRCRQAVRHSLVETVERKSPHEAAYHKS